MTECGTCAGMTDWDITSAWSTLGVLIVGAWAGKSSGAVVAALVMSGATLSAVCMWSSCQQVVVPPGLCAAKSCSHR